MANSVIIFNTSARVHASALANHTSSRALFANKYILLNKLGEGGNGTVYLAFSLQHNKKVVLKIAQAGLSSKILQEEAKILRNLSRLNFAGYPQYFDFGSIIIAGEECRYLAMSYVEGKNLFDTYLNRPPFEKMALWVTKEIALHLIPAHTNGIIHCDIKPQNIVFPLKLADTGRYGETLVIEPYPVLVDWGSYSNLPTGEIVCTPHYASVKLLSGGQPCPQDDICALGGVLFFLLTGKQPFYD